MAELQDSGEIIDENGTEVNYENIDPNAFTNQEWKELLMEKQKDVELAAQVGAALVSENLKLNEEINKLKDTISQYDTSGLTMSETDNDTVERDAKNAKDYMNTMDSIKELTEQKKQLKTKILQLQQELENSEQGRFVLLDQFMDVSKQMEALRKEIRDDQEANRTLKQMIETQKSAISEYEQVIQNQQQTISEVTKQKSTLAQTLNSLQKNDSSPLAELESLNKQLREELEAAENKLLKVSEGSRRLESENIELRQFLSDKDSMAEIIKALMKENNVIKQQQEETLNLLEQSKITAKQLSDRLEEVTMENATIVTNNKDVISTKGTLRGKHKGSNSASLTPADANTEDGVRSRRSSVTLKKQTDDQTGQPTQNVSDPGMSGNPEDWSAVMHRMKRTSVRLRQDFNESSAMLKLDDFKAKSNTYNEKKQRTLRLQKDQLAALTSSSAQLTDLPSQSSPQSTPDNNASVTNAPHLDGSSSENTNNNPELESLKQMMDSLTEKLKDAASALSNNNNQPVVDLKGKLEKQLVFHYAEEKNVEEDLICPVCIDPVWEPMEHSCGRLICEKCVKQLKGSCPICRESLGAMEKVRSKYVLNKVKEIMVKCPNCTSKLQRGDLLDHVLKCPVVCPIGCGKKIAPLDEEKHQQECPAQVTKCSASDVGCIFQSTRNKMQDHKHVCSFAQIAPQIRQVQHTREYQVMQPIICGLLQQIQSLCANIK